MSAQLKKRVIIVGSGIIGLSIAYYLQKEGHDSLASVALLEREAQPALGASGKAGGFMAKTWCDHSGLRALAHRSFDLHTAFALDLSTHPRACPVETSTTGFRFTNTLSVRIDEGGKGDVRTERSRSLLAASDLPNWIDQRSFVKGEVLSALESKQTAQVNPKALCETILATMQERASLVGFPPVTLHCNVHVVGFQKKSAGTYEVIVEEKGKRKSWGEAETLVVASGAWGGELVGSLLPRMHLVGTVGHSIVFRPSVSPTAHALFVDFEGNDGVTVEPEVYPRPDGTLYMCGLADDPQPAPAGGVSAVQTTSAKAARLKQIAEAVCPQIRDPSTQVVATQACMLPSAADGLPVMGQVPQHPGLFVAVGHTFWGIMNSLATGEAMAGLILTGKSPQVDLAPFDPARFA